MSNRFSLSIRTYMIILVLLMTFVSFGIITYSAMEERKLALQGSSLLADRLRDEVSNEQSVLLSGAEQLLSSLAYIPCIQNRDAKAASILFAELLKKNPKIPNIVIADNTGLIWASALPRQDGIMVNDRRFFKNAMATGKFSSGEYTIGRIQKVTVLSFGYPIKDPSGKIRDIAFVAIKLNELLNGKKIPDDSSLVLTDHKGTILFDATAPEFAGHQDKEDIFKRMAEGPDKGNFEATGITGKHRFFAYQKLRLNTEQTPYIYVRAGILTETVLSKIRNDLMRNVGMMTSITLLALGFAVYISKRGIMDKIIALRDATQQVSQGNLDVHVSNYVSGGELGELAHAFDKMARMLADDMASRKQTEEKLIYIIKAVESTSDAVGISDSLGHHIYQNKALTDLFGYATAEELEAAGGGAAVIKDPAVAKEMFDNIISGKSWFGELEMVTKSGHVFSAFERADAIIDNEGNLIGLIGIITDITERKRAEEALINSEQFIRNVLDTVDEGFIVIDRDFRILTANKTYCNQSGKICDDVIGMHCYEISHRLLRPCYEGGEDCAVRNVFDTGEPSAAIHRHIDAQGVVLYVETKAFPLKDSSGAVTSVIETINNISEKHLLEEERLKTQKLEAIGTLAGGIAHDFNNLLQGVFGYISMAKITMDPKERSFEMLQQAEQALHMSVNLTKQLLTFSRGGKPVRKKIQLQPLIDNSVRFAMSGSKAEYRISLDADLWTVEADEGQIGQVIQNIVLNADQAMPAGGTIAITAKNVQKPKKTLSKSLGEGKYVEISVQDSGIGIAGQYLHKIFDPYFTTKEKGSGLGLATSYSIIRNHGGVIDIASEPGKGTTFFVYLPAVKAEIEAPISSAVSPTLHKGKILVMDDEELIRNIAREMIMSLGHDVDLTEHGEAAIEKYKTAKESGNPFDIVILDLTVRGGLGGRETLQQLLAIDPDVRAIVSSGYSDNAVVSDYHTYGFRARLTKPYNVEELRDTLNTLLS